MVAMTAVTSSDLRAWARNDVITWRRFEALGISRAAVRSLVRRELLFPAHRGVWFLSANPTHLARYTAATARCAPTGLLCHGAAAHLWDLIPRWHGPPHVTVPKHKMRRPDGIVLHHTTRPTARATRHDIPATTLTRTLDDYTRHASPHEIKRALRQAEYHHALDLAALDAQTRNARLRSVLRGYVPGQGKTDSELEADFYELAARAGLPRPVLQHRTPGGRADFLFAELRLLVEVDGYAAHRGRIAFREDRARDRANQLAGLTTVRYTWEDVTLEPDALAEELASIASSLSTAASTKS